MPNRGLAGALNRRASLFAASLENVSTEGQITSACVDKRGAMQVRRRDGGQHRQTFGVSRWVIGLPPQAAALAEIGVAGRRGAIHGARRRHTMRLHGPRRPIRRFFGAAAWRDRSQGHRSGPSGGDSGFDSSAEPESPR